MSDDVAAPHRDVPDWSTIPAPVDDGAVRHIKGRRLPPVQLLGTDWKIVDLSRLKGRTVVFIYPRTAPPDGSVPEGWDGIPGARGCTAQCLAFRDRIDELGELGVHQLFGLSTQDTRYQREAAGRLELPFPLLSDAGLTFAKALRLPMMDVPGMALLRRMTLMIDDGTVKDVLYPVFPPDRSVDAVLDWLRANPRPWP
ncbi:peroxiredoxin [Muricoccus radiodurans]|uniref:peroxiredoxin n=1 Tax=Muricoccus radiodurans TaxID=2231721 RepID=UPI003CF5FF7E